MKIALLSNGLFPESIGGMQKHSTLMAQHLARLGTSVDVYAPTWEDTGDASGIDLENGQLDIQVLRAPPGRRRRHPGHYLAECYDYSRNLLSAHRDRLKSADLIYIQGFSGWALLNEKAGGASFPPTVLNFHGLEMFQRAASLRDKLQHWMFRPWVKRLIKKADYVQSLGGKLTPILSRWKSEDCIIVQGIGIPDDWMCDSDRIQENVLRVCFVGRYARLKGIEEIIAAVKEFGHLDRLHITFIGPIPHDKQLCSSNVTYLGEVRDPKRIQAELQNSDVLLCPSYSEGMPTVILEAMACECAIIATDVGAVSELVDAANGWLMPAPRPALIRDAIQKASALSDPSLQEMKSASRRRVQERFTWEIVARQMQRRFQDIATNVA
jgi:glycosyltransferase involved in cell wall biosynthesis